MKEITSTPNGQVTYASVDLELSGFDVVEDEIIEVGIVKFELQDGKLVILDTYESLVRPSSAVRSRVLGLTGIDSAEAASAPVWDVVRPEVQAFLGGATIIGHGVELDIKFLRAKGVVCESNPIDTLELAQIFLPTHHSYNLENLAHELLVPHTSAHRALADAEATVGVLRAICGIYNSLPGETRDRIAYIARQGGLVWGQFVALASQERYESEKLAPALQPTWNRFLPNIEVLRGELPPWVLALGERDRVLAVAKETGIDAYLGAFEQVSPRAVAVLEEDLAILELKTLLSLCKVLVWQAQGPKFGILAELNWSIVGTEQKKLFTGGITSYPPRHMTATDYRSLFDFRDRRGVWIEQLDGFLQFLEQKSATQLTWHGLLGLLRQIYNHETGQGDESQANAVLAAVAAVDAYFATTLILLRRELSRASGTVSFADMGGYVERKLGDGAFGLARQLASLLPKYAREANFGRAVENLRQFFMENMPGTVSWVEYGDGRCAFVRRSLDLSSFVQPLLRQHSSLKICTDIKNDELRGLLLKRLGVLRTDKHMLDIRDFNFANAQCLITDESLHEEVNRRTQTARATIFIFPSMEDLKEYYDASFSDLDKPSAVVAVGIHGGAHKVLRNFSHNSKSVVLAAVPQLAAYSGSLPAFDEVVYVGVPRVDERHPMVAAIGKLYFENTDDCIRTLTLLAFLQSIRPFQGKINQNVSIVAARADEIMAKLLTSEIS